ncbi:MAG: enoyl-CoA hydratase/isomerase family protein [Renibacterium sp.]|nr:enoyl-CoA hydratase/isomerase family protein [Renibacterium sp.]
MTTAIGRSRQNLGHGVVTIEYPLPSVALVTLNRPESLNAISAELIDDLNAAFTELGSDDEVSVVVLTGAGRGFCSGADLSALGSMLAENSALELMRESCRWEVLLARLPQVTIAAVNGPAIGAGWSMAMACDLRVAGPEARFGATFVRMGLGPDCGLSQTLPRAVGRERAMELLCTGRIIDQAEALRIGLVSTTAEDARSAALALAGNLTAAPGRALRSIKQTLFDAAEASVESVIDEVEARAQAALFDHPDFAAGAAQWMSRHGGAQPA